ncbi:Dynamin-related protein DNM1 [Mycena venus]|uniref:Dynamin-related protein DNM1 n=1 Tax=Mycena venus TaxID=2733690 RepID=A0A8H6YEN7_9AGAR|nr:Dynamin-related protein DNM1 [Mycena venus]
MDTDLIKLVNKLQDTFNNLGAPAQPLFISRGQSIQRCYCRGGAGHAPTCSCGQSISGKVQCPRDVSGHQTGPQFANTETASLGGTFFPAGKASLRAGPSSFSSYTPPESKDPSPSSPTFREWAQFLHIDKKFTDFQDIRKEIEQETFRVAGQNKGVSKLPISLRIYSPDVLDLTLVDLPGLTKIPVGDQPSDIERQIRNLVLDYITKPNSVILSVSPANVDLANSESLKLARQVDPQGRRTIGVLTKLDLMDAGTNALDILTGRVYPLKLGFIGVVNRSQQDINGEKSMEAALNSETGNGTKYLAKTLNQVLMNHIRDKLPDMKARLNTLMGQAQQELNSFGDSDSFGDQNQQGALILRLMTQFARDFVASIEGTKVDISTKELSGGARIYYIFNDVFGQALDSIDSTANLDNQDIRTAIRNSTGPRPSLFVPEIAFDLLVKPQIKLLEAPSLRCVELVYEELVKICHNCTSTVRLTSGVTELTNNNHLGAATVPWPACKTHRSRFRIVAGTTGTHIRLRAEFDRNTGSVHQHEPSRLHLRLCCRRTAGQLPPARQMPLRPASTEPTNGTGTDEDADSSDENGLPNGIFPPRNNERSVSATIHDRGRTSIGSTPTLPNTVSAARKFPNQQRPHSAMAQTQPHRGSPPSARETFLNYFFGQNGPGPIAGSSVMEQVGHGHQMRPTAGGASVVPVGRDVSAADSNAMAIASGLATQRDGSNAAYDMKSLGKHIEAIPSDGNHLTLREEMETSLIRSLIASYFGIVRQSIQDLIPKAIMHFLVNHTSYHVQNRLVASLYKPELFQEMLHEDEGLVAERARVKALLDAYKEAFKVLSDVNVKPT